MNLTVSLPDHSYDITIERGVLARAGERLRLDRRVFIVTDDGVPALYARTLAAQCRRAEVLTVPQGEGSKSLETYGKLLETMLLHGVTRGDAVAAVGGGVVGDLAGFAAATVLRGVDFYNLPTTVLSMVDSSVGGKTAINHAGMKNMVGAFYQPKAVLIDPDTLQTLPRRQIASGLAEAVKMALTSDAALFARLERPDGVSDLEAVIAAALQIKASVVERDEKEQNLRRVLNFGHTLGHGIEAQGGLTHGECVGLGMLPMCAPAVRARLLPVLERLGLPRAARFDPDRAVAAIAHDKKAGPDGVTVVTVPAVGTFQFEKMSLETLRARLLELREAP